MVIKISSNNQQASFNLYDTEAARELFNQLPLKLELSNFRDAQWMFYPPKKLNVKPTEAYHDGKKGELSYYQPWGDVFMLHKDFYAGDEMHRLGICLDGIDTIALMSGEAVIAQSISSQLTQKNENMKIQIKVANKSIIFELNNSQASKDLYAQLPLTIDVEDYGGKEKIFYPPHKLNTSNTPKANAKAGSLSYYAPWGDVVMFYKNFGSASGLYDLGKAVSGAEHIEQLSGSIVLEKQ